MKNEQDMVREFMVQAKQEGPSKPKIPDVRTGWLRIHLIQEELNELDDAIAKEDIVKTADGIGDLLYVVLGTAVACGIDITPIFHEIHRSNMTKFIDGTFREDGKYVKGPSYSKADLETILKEQIK